jgi:hypothetical protein
MAPESDGGWDEYRRLILQELQRLHEGVAEVNAKIGALTSLEIAGIKAEIAVLKFKSGLWGFTAGAVPGVIALIYAAVKT